MIYWSTSLVSFVSGSRRLKRVCQFCGDSFTAKTTVTKFCGDNCAKRAYKLQVKKVKSQRSNTEPATTLNQAWVNASQKDYLNVKETCVFMGISRTTLWRLASNDSLSAKSNGRKRIFRNPPNAKPLLGAGLFVKRFRSDNLHLFRFS